MPNEKYITIVLKFAIFINNELSINPRKREVTEKDIDSFISTLPEEKEEKLKGDMRIAVANYMASEGCSCCQDVDAHKEHKKRLADLLNVEPYEDNAGYNFHKYQNAYKLNH